MRKDTDGDDNEISEYQLLMKSLACQLQTRHITVAEYTSLQGVRDALSNMQRASQTENMHMIKKAKRIWCYLEHIFNFHIVKEVSDDTFLPANIHMNPLFYYFPS